MTTIQQAIKGALSDEVSEMVRGIGVENVVRVEFSATHSARGSIYVADIEHEVHATATLVTEGSAIIVRLTLEVTGPVRRDEQVEQYYALGSDAAKDRAATMKAVRAFVVALVGR